MGSTAAHTKAYAALAGTDLATVKNAEADLPPAALAARDALGEGDAR